MGQSHEVEFKLYGDDMQFVEIELDGQEGIIAEAGAMMYMDQGVEMETIFGDGSAKEADKGLKGKLLSAGKRLVTGEGLFTTAFTNKAAEVGHVAFAAPYPGKIIPFDLAEIGGEGFIMQKLEGDGLAFLHAGGTIIRKDLEPGQVLRIDTGCLVAMSSLVQYDIQFTGDIKSSLFGGEGLFLATLQGPGSVWLQSLPFSRMADRVMAASKGANKGESKGMNNPLEELSGLTNLFGKN